MRNQSTISLFLLLLLFIIIQTVTGQDDTTDPASTINAPNLTPVLPGPTTVDPSLPTPTTDPNEATGGDVANIDDEQNSPFNSDQGLGGNSTLPKAGDTAPGISDDPFPFVNLNKSTIDINKMNMRAPDPMLEDTLFYLHYHAREYSYSNGSRTTVYTVVTKMELAPSNDSHDYLSLARYFWANTGPNPLPYVRHDGRVNPEIELAPDYSQFRVMLKAVTYLAYGFFFYDDEDFAAKGIKHIEAWFIDPQTRMNPHLQFASLIRGYNTGRAKGLIDWHVVPDLFNAIALLQSSVHWKPGTNAALRQWFGQYRDWLWNSPNGQLEYSSLNNHGTYYNIQYSSILLFLGQTDEARAFLQNSTRRIDAQIVSTGQQPYETSRPFSYFYSIFNLVGFFQLSNIASGVGVDLYNYESPSGASIRKALDYIFPHIPETFNNSTTWPFNNTGGYNATYDLPAILNQAYIIYGDVKYLNKANAIQKAWTRTSNMTRITLPWEKFGDTNVKNNLNAPNAGASTNPASSLAVICAIVATVTISLLGQ